MNRLLELQQKLADDAARATVECHCMTQSICEGTTAFWYSTNQDDAYDTAFVNESIEYLTLRGRIQRHPEHADWVRVDMDPVDAKPEQHPDDIAVDTFAAAMKRKLAAKRDQGYGGWQDKAECSAERLSILLRKHVAKGDPIDVANFCMMLFNRGERITQAVEMAEQRAPVQGYTGGIPWSMHLRAYEGYCKKWGRQPEMIEGSCRGGFHTDELDDFIPGWRDELSENARLKAEFADLKTEIESKDRMFLSACSDLGLINEALELDPDDGGADPILDAIAELKAERGADRLDGERYRFLKSLTWNIEESATELASWSVQFEGLYGCLEFEDHIDTAIDAAVAQQKGEK